MIIERATDVDLERIMEIYVGAVEYMCTNGNPNQWINGYPSRGCVEEDIAKGNLYVMRADHGEIVAQFCYFVGDDPTYSHIEGAWLNDKPYGVVHRLASDGTHRGVADVCLDWCFPRHPNMRIDTHADNKIMQQILLKNGYVECGEITGSNGTSRLAYHKIR